MRLRTIWTVPCMTVQERLRRTQNWLAMTIGAKLPLRVRYWVTMQELGKTVVLGPEGLHITLDEVVKRLDTPKDMLR